ncbi:MAG: retention module-containing protein, partial [Quisquiliibacterium sp.]
MATIATVISVTGKVFAYNPVTRVGRLLKEGDTIERDEIVRSSDGAEISLKTQDGKFLGFGGEQAVQLDDSVSPAAGTPKIATEDGSLRPESIIAALNRGDDLSLSLEATAAGLGGGGGQGNGGFVRLLRIAENVDPLAFQYDTALLPGLPGLQSDATPIEDVTVQIYALVDGKLYKLSEVPEGAEATYVVYLTDTLTGQIIDNARGTVQITFTNG